MFKVNNKNTKTFGVFIVNFEYISHHLLLFLLLTLKKYMLDGKRDYPSNATRLTFSK